MTSLASPLPLRPRRARRTGLELLAWVGLSGLAAGLGYGVYSLASAPFTTTIDSPLALPLELVTTADSGIIPLPPVGATTATTAAAVNAPAVVAAPTPGAESATTVAPVATATTPAPQVAGNTVTAPTAPSPATPVPTATTPAPAPTNAPAPAPTTQAPAPTAPPTTAAPTTTPATTPTTTPRLPDPKNQATKENSNSGPKSSFGLEGSK